MSSSSSSTLQLVRKPIAPYRQPLLLIIDEEDEDNEGKEKEEETEDKDTLPSQMIRHISIDAMMERDKTRRKLEKKDKTAKKNKRKKKKDIPEGTEEEEGETKSTYFQNLAMNELTSKLEDLIGDATTAAPSSSTSSTPRRLPPLERPTSAGAALQTYYIEPNLEQAKQVVQLLVKSALQQRPSTASARLRKKSDVTRASASFQDGSGSTRAISWKHHTFVSPKHEILAQLHASQSAKKHRLQQGSTIVTGQEANDISKQLVPPKFRHLQHFQVDDSGRDYVAIVIVEVVQCDDLRNSFSKMQTKGIADPYVEVSMGYQIETTETIDNDLSPVFNEVIILCWDGQTDLRLKVKDSDDHNEEELLGQFRVKINQLELDSKQEFYNERLNDADGRTERHGSITFSVTIKGTPHPNKFPSRPASRTTSFAKETVDEYDKDEFEV